MVGSSFLAAGRHAIAPAHRHRGRLYPWPTTPPGPASSPFRRQPAAEHPANDDREYSDSDLVADADVDAEDPPPCTRYSAAAHVKTVLGGLLALAATLATTHRPPTTGQPGVVPARLQS